MAPMEWAQQAKYGNLILMETFDWPIDRQRTDATNQLRHSTCTHSAAAVAAASSGEIRAET